MERYWLVAASFCFLLSFGRTLFALGSGIFRPSRFNLITMAAGFLFETAFLYQRGHAIGACPITNLFDVLIFLSWSIVLIYLLVGPAYRLSLMGAFTSPLVLSLILLALLAPLDRATPPPVHNSWVEFHAALSLIAYGAFGLGCISGVMYLVQERQLKSRKVSDLLLSLPPITELHIANGRLLLVGFVLLTIAFGAGIASHMSIPETKRLASMLIWALYGCLLLARRFHLLSPGRAATASIAIFAIALVTLPSVSHLSAQ
ncbi:MAG TPA: cytochrome c biogenesis protein CcsA [Chthoniobacterales bacterium]